MSNRAGRLKLIHDSRPRREDTAFKRRWLRRVTVPIALAAAGVLLPLQAEEPPSSNRPADDKTGTIPWQFTDIDRKRHDPFADESVKAIAVVFIATDCPIANYFQPTLRRLASQYREKGIPFFLFYPDPDTTADDAKTHKTEYKIRTPVFLDPDFVLAKRLQATAVPEAFVIRRDGTIAYRGRIDNTYEDWGKRRPEPTRHDLRDALEAVLAGKALPKEHRVTKSIGCFIPYELHNLKRPEAN